MRLLSRVWFIGTTGSFTDNNNFQTKIYCPVPIKDMISPLLPKNKNGKNRKINFSSVSAIAHLSVYIATSQVGRGGLHVLSWEKFQLFNWKHTNNNFPITIVQLTKKNTQTKTYRRIAEVWRHHHDAYSKYSTTDPFEIQFDLFSFFNIETFISITQNTTIILKSIQFYIPKKIYRGYISKLWSHLSRSF